MHGKTVDNSAQHLPQATGLIAKPVEMLSLVTGDDSEKRPRGTETVLLVEDEQEVRQFLGDILRRSGYTVLEAKDGAEAVQISERHPNPIHLMVTDVVMPAISGHQLVQCLTQLRPEMKILYISGYVDDPIVSYGVLAKAVPLLPKPFSEASLLRKVRDVLDGEHRD